MRKPLKFHEKASESRENSTWILENVLIYKEVSHVKKAAEIHRKIFHCILTENTNIYHIVELWLDLIECADLRMHKDNIQESMCLAHLLIHYLENMINLNQVEKCLSSKKKREEVDFWLTSKHSEWFVPYLAFKIKDTRI